MLTKKLTVMVLALGFSTAVFAGNKDRAGQAGANELLLNPWTRSSGFANSNASMVRGLEASFLNVAGLAFTKKTEVLFCNTNLFTNSGIKLNAFGFSQKVSKTGVLALSITSLSFGDIPITTVDKPEGGIGTFSIQLSNINLSYAKEFSHSIFGGFNVKFITQSLPSVSASGIAVDAGIQYLTGTNEEKNNMHFGIALKNVGAPMKYGGDGLSLKRANPVTGELTTVETRSSLIELPATLNMSAAYDFALAELHRITASATFISNSYLQNQMCVGVEYGFKNYFMIRGGYAYENNGTKDDAKRTNIFTGPSAGFTFETPFNSNGSTIGLDYAYRVTNPLNGVHSIGVRLNL